MIRIDSLTKQYGNFTAVQNINFDVPTGAFLVLVGPSGCGKSTMLRMLAGLETPTGGSIQFNGKTVSEGASGWTIEPAERNTGLVFQSYALWPHMTVGGNVEWPLKVAGLQKANRRARVQEVLELLGIGKLSARYPNEISGGQQQRVAIARMIAPKPGILLFDEPLSNLDAKLRVEMRTELLRIHRSTGATSVYVTHDQVEAMTMASHVAVMNGGQIEQFGSPEELVTTPSSDFVATFVGTPPANVIAGNLIPEAHTLSSANSGGSFMFRAEDISVSHEAKPGAIELDFAEASPLAGRSMITGTRNGFRLTAVTDIQDRFSVGETIHFILPAVAAARFDDQGKRV
ncbi:ABC transporter ATP-binding protein [Brucella pituitosa]|uniref:ABC transporter ATP-binding protein n=1 Tax=Brucella pituitosa TaxID=571256 RepID=UPI003F4AB374